jgi:hypothetical protein
MPAVYEIRFLPDGRVQRVAGSRGNYYEFPDGSRIDMQTTPAWCRRCRELTEGESIESLKEIDRQLADLDDPSSTLYRMTARGVLHELTGGGEEYRQQTIERTHARRRWREARQSPPRCIACGTTDIFIFPFDQPAPNPAGPGMVELRCVGMCSTSFNEWFFTPEGERIPRDTQPTYWHHPALDNRPGAALRFVQRLIRRRGPKGGR